MSRDPSRVPTYEERKYSWRNADRARRYDRKRYGNVEGRLSNTRALDLYARALRDFRQGGIVADCPCGTGRAMPIIRESGFRAIGLDIAREMIEVGRSKLGEDGAVAWVTGDIEALPFRDGALEGLICLRLMQHCPQEVRVRMLKEMARVCREAFLVNYHSKYTFKYASRWVRRKIGLRKRPVGGIGRRELDEDAALAGLRIGFVRSVFPLLSTHWVVRFEKP